MSALEQWDDESFTHAVMGIIEDEIREQINLAAERGNEQISWDEFRGNYQ